MLPARVVAATTPVKLGPPSPPPSGRGGFGVLASVAVAALLLIFTAQVAIAAIFAWTTNGSNTVTTTQLFSPTGLGGSRSGSSDVLTWSAAQPNNNGNGNGYAISGVDNGGSSTCPTTAASYTTYVGSTAALTYTDSGALASGAAGTYVCYLVQTGYKTAGGPPWAALPQWTSRDTLPTVAIQLVTAITHVQNRTNLGSTGGSGTLTATLTSAVNAGDLLVGTFRGSGTVTVSDNKNGSWTQVGAGTANVYLFYLQNSVAAAANGLIITMSVTAAGNTRISADEFAGVASSFALDQNTYSNSGSTQSTTWNAPLSAAVPAGELVYAGAGSANNNATFTAGTTNGVSMTLGGQVTNGSNGSMFSEYALSAAAGGQNSSVTASAIVNLNGGQATFRP